MTPIDRRSISCAALAAAVVLLAGAPLRAANLVSPVAEAQDIAGASRNSFSSTERISLSIRVQNTAVSASLIQFSFQVKDPQGSVRLTQSGNAAPGSTVGFTGATIRGIAVSQFYNVPGQYTLVARATLGAETVEAQASFSVQSPVITLTYPPNGARDIIDQPLVFRWVSSGATRYRLFVDDDVSFYNALFSGESFSNFLSYPQNPPDIRQRLASGQMYYWRVEGLDATGNVIAKTDVPFAFTVKSEAAQSTSKDLAIVNLERVNEPVPGLPGAWPIAVYVKNQGGRPESNASVNLFADGAAAPTSPKRINQIEPGRTDRMVFPVRPPDSGRPLLVNAVIDLFDDNLQNNTMTRQFRAEESQERRPVRAQETWEAVRRFLVDATLLAELEGYTVAEAVIDGLSESEVAALIAAVRDGRARVTGARLRD